MKQALLLMNNSEALSSKHATTAWKQAIMRHEYVYFSMNLVEVREQLACAPYNS